MNPLFILAIGLIILIIIESIHPILPDVAICIYFMFAYINVEAHDWLATFYLIMALFTLMFIIARSRYAIQDKPSIMIKGKRLEGAKLLFTKLLVGFMMFGFMVLIASGKKEPGSIIGVPLFAMSGPGWSVLTAALLGRTENRFIFGLFEIIKGTQLFVKLQEIATTIISMIPVLGPVLRAMLTVIFKFTVIFVFLIPVGLLCYLFAFFHYAAFNAQSVLLWWAFLVMMMWIISYIIFKDSLSADTCHYSWNGRIAVSELMSIA